MHEVAPDPGPASSLACVIVRLTPRHALVLYTLTLAAAVLTMVGMGLSG